MTANPAISVVMPVFNEATYLHEAIESILYQTFSNFEFIIINDASTDNSLEIIKSYNDSRIILLQNEINLGIAKTLNLGIDYVRGEFIARIDGNDVALPDRLNEQYKFFKMNLNCGIVTSPVIQYSNNVNGEDIIEGPYIPYEEIPVSLLFSNCIYHTAVMLRKVALPNPVYDENSAAEDYDLWSRLIEDWDIHILKEPLMKVRCIPSGLRFQEKNLIDAELVKEKLINKLEIYPSNREKIIHNIFIGDINYLSIKNKVQMILWLNKIYNANIYNEYFSINILNNRIKVYLGKILTSRKNICVILFYFFYHLNIKKIKPLSIRQAISIILNH